MIGKNADPDRALPFDPGQPLSVSVAGGQDLPYPAESIKIQSTGRIPCIS
jgi:hypothetical protein